MQDFYQQSIRGVQQSLQNPQRPFGVSVIALVIGLLGTFYLLLMMVYLSVVNVMGFDPVPILRRPEREPGKTRQPIAQPWWSLSWSASESVNSTARTSFCRAQSLCSSATQHRGNSRFVPLRALRPSPGSITLLPKIDVDANTPSIILAIIYLTFMAVAYLGMARGLYLTLKCIFDGGETTCDISSASIAHSCSFCLALFDSGRSTGDLQSQEKQSYTSTKLLLLSHNVFFR